MACCKCCCGNEDCSEGQQGKCCCGGAEGTCCSETQYCCDGVCEDEPCDECVTNSDCGCLEAGKELVGTCSGAAGEYCCPPGELLDDVGGSLFGYCTSDCSDGAGASAVPGPALVCCDGVCEELCPPP